MSMVKRVLSDDSKCVGCRICMVTCSLVNFGEIDLAKSRIKILEKSGNSFGIRVCNNCGICAAYCPQGAISIVNKTLYIDDDLCNGCGVCIEKCPTNAIWWSPGLPSPNKCLACGACVDNCPTGALRIIESEIKIAEIAKKIASR